MVPVGEDGSEELKSSDVDLVGEVPKLEVSSDEFRRGVERGMRRSELLVSGLRAGKGGNDDGSWREGTIDVEDSKNGEPVGHRGHGFVLRKEAKRWEESQF